ncbi:hypothetical protein ASPCADRAFT_3366 [Aspergillus carbonarius ITEM 5010]|uniref:SDH C-terminal domain-containing protein n=1 Tax=Aspergillus carbonarius (strain ITEM 5010) TaxID=602072 RepID=A0A1R3RV05_ASPC5|nr:hypothetical protein ASPCADRAFT_3366 [Aspergillus carbonarius ITEM 5010]
MRCALAFSRERSETEGEAETTSPNPTIIISCVPGWDPESKSPVRVELPESWLTSPTGGLFVDAAYGLPEPSLRAQIRARRNPEWQIVDGVSVLFEQSIQQYQIFTGRPAPIHVMSKALEEQSIAHPPDVMQID